MVKAFEEDGIRFQYPENWQLEREEADSGWTVIVQSPNTSFLLISYNEDQPSADQMLDSTLEGLREVYPDVEAYEEVDTLAGLPAVGHDIHFTSLDLTNTCWTRCFYTDAATVLIFWQATDADLEQTEPVLKAICASLQVAD
jgi:hypothetical protein